MNLPRLRLFVSSPGDVAEERVLTARVIRRLQAELSSRVVLESFFWEHEPLLATRTFQAQIARPSETDIVVTVLWARLGTRLPPDMTRSDGSHYQSGTEYEFEDAIEGWRRTGSPDLLVYRKTAESLVSLNDRKALLENLAQKEALDQFIGKWFHDAQHGTLIAAFHPFRDSSEYERLLEEHLRKLIERRVPPVHVHVPARAAATWTEGSPFRGLEVFEFEHAPIFFGRTKAVADILAALRAQAAHRRPFVAVVGVSGSGKSSLVRAGVVPLLVQPGVIEGVRGWRHAVLRPSNSPGDLFDGLAAALTRPEALPELTNGVTVAELALLFREAPSTAFVPLKSALSLADVPPDGPQKTDSESRLVLTIDQAEELFTLDAITVEHRQRFATVVAALVRSEKVWVILTLRSDFYPRLLELQEIVSLKEGAGQYDLLPPTPTEIGQMIRQPAVAAGLAFEEDPQTNARLDDVLRDAAAQNPESLPLLEFALEELYRDRSPDDVLTHATYRRIGGVEGALAQRAETVFGRLAPDVQAALPDVLRALSRIEIGESEALVRKPAPLAAVAGTPQRKALVDAFVTARLFTTGLSDEGIAIVTIAHEALFSHWPRLQRWLENDRELLRIRTRVTTAAALWQAEARRSDLLLSDGKPLAEAELLAQARGIELGTNEKDYVRASIAKARRRKWVRRTATAALVLLTTMALSAAWISTALLAEGMAAEGDAFGLANRWAEAMERYERAQGILRSIGSSTLVVDLGLLEASEQSPIPLNAFVADGTPHFGFNGYIFDLAWSNDELRVLSVGADEAVKVWDARTGRRIRLMPGQGQSDTVAMSPDGRLAVSAAGETLNLWDVASGHLLRTFAGHTGTVYASALSPSGRLALTGSSDNTVRLWDVDTGQMLRTFTGHSDIVNDVAFISDAIAVSASKDGTVRTWDVRNGTEIRSFVADASGVFSLAVASGGPRAVSGGWGAAVKLWDLTTGRELRTMLGHSEEVAALAISSDGRYALSGSNDASARLWDLETGVHVRTLAHGDDVRATAIAPDGSKGATAGKGGQIKLWDLHGQGDVRTLRGHTAGVTAVAFSPDGRTAVSGSNDKTLRVWDLETGQTLVTMPVEAAVRAVAVSPNGRLMAYTCSDGVLRLRDLEGGQARTFEGRATMFDSGVGAEVGVVSSLVFYSDEVLLGGEVRTVFSSLEYFDGWKAWNVPTGREQPLNEAVRRRDLILRGVPRSPAHSYDGALIASKEVDGSLTLYSGTIWARLLDFVTSEERRPLRSLRGHSGPVLSVAFSDVGHRLLSGGADTTLRFRDLDRMTRFRQFERSLENARTRLQQDEKDGAALKVFGDWYAFRGEWKWAVEMLEQARGAGAADVSSTTLAQAYWQTGNLDAARREFQQALYRNEAAALYIQLCLKAVDTARLSR